jgi:hypothetical protein
VPGYVIRPLAGRTQRRSSLGTMDGTPLKPSFSYRTAASLVAG